MKNPKVSVCMPNYNYGHFIGQAIQSVSDQTFTDFELIIVDDTSTDNSVSVIQSFFDPRIRFYRNEKNIGRVKNINKCISLAQGEYITILPSDGMYTSDSLAKRAKILDSNPSVGLVFSSAKIIGEKGVIIRESRRFQDNWIMRGEKVFKSLILGNYIPALTSMVRKECYTVLGTFNEEIATGMRDWEMWLRVALNYDVAYIQQSLAFEREHSGNISDYYFRTNIGDMNAYMIIKTIFYNLQKEKRYLLSLEDQALKALAVRMLRKAGKNLMHGYTKVARKNIGLAIAFDDDLIKDWRTYSLFFLTFLGKGARILDKMPRFVEVLQALWLKDGTTGRKDSKTPDRFV